MMKLMKKLIVMLLIVMLLVPAMPKASYAMSGSTSTPGLTKEQQDFLVSYVHEYLMQGWSWAKEHGKNPWYYTVDPQYAGSPYRVMYYQNEPDKRGNLEQTPNQNMRMCCSVVVGSLLHQALGVDIMDEGTSIRNASLPRNHPEWFTEIAEDEALQPGDVVCYNGYSHAVLYLGCVPEEYSDDPILGNYVGQHYWVGTGGGVSGYGGTGKVGYTILSSVQPNTPMTVNTMRRYAPRGSSGHYAYYAYRLKPEMLENFTMPEFPMQILWPNDGVGYWDGTTISSTIQYQSTGVTSGSSSLGDKYEGIAESIGPLGYTQSSLLGKIWDGFKDLLDYFIGMVTMVARIPFVGIARAIEWAVSSVVEVITTQPMDATLTLEKIVYNQIPFFDINVFNAETTGEHEIIEVLRTNVAQWYMAFRNLVLTILLVILIYLAIRMAISSIAEEKAQYKRMLVDWLISFFMVLFIHYFIVIVMQVNDALVKMFYNYVQGEVGEAGSIYELVSEKAHAIKFTEGWYGTILYIALVWFMIKYAWKYIKRLLSAFILIILSPFVAVTYAIDKIKDNRSQSLSKWLKEIAYTVLIQSVHALIYTVFLVGIVLKITGNSDVMQAIGACVFLVIAVKFMDTAEDIFENIFGFKSSSALQEILDSTFEIFTKAKMAKEFVVGYTKLMVGTAKAGGKLVGKGGKVVIDVAQKHSKPIKKAVDFVDGEMEKLKNSYYEGLEGITLTQEGTVTKIGSLIETEKKKQEAQLKSDRAKANKMLNASTKIAKNSILGVTRFIENPQASIAHIIAAGTTLTTLNKTFFKRRGTSIRRPTLTGPMTFTGEKENRQRMELLGKILEEDRKLQSKINEAYQQDGILTKGNKPGATEEEIKKAKLVERILNSRYYEVSKFVSREKIQQAITSSVLENRMATIEEIVGAVIEKLEKINSEVKFNKEQVQKNFIGELQKIIKHNVTAETESVKVVYSRELHKQIETAKQTASKQVKKFVNKNQLKDEKIEEIVEEIIENYYRQEEHQEELNEIVQKMSVEELTHVMTRVMNQEDSIQRDYHYQIQPDSYNRAIEQAMQQKEPISLSELNKFARQIEKNLPKDQKGSVTQNFSKNVKQKLGDLQSARSEKVAKQTFLQDDRITQIMAEVEKEGVTESRVKEAIFEKLTTEEKTKLFTLAVNRETTNQENNREAIKQVIQQNEPKSLGELSSLAKTIERKLPNGQKGMIAPTLDENVRQKLNTLKKAINGKGASQAILSDDRIEQINIELEKDGASEEATEDAIFEKLSTEEKMTLILSAINIEGSTEVDEELQKYDAIVEQAARLRESYIENLDRMNIPIPEIVEDIKRRVKAQEV